MIDTTNKFFVAARGDGVLVMSPPVRAIDKQDALLLAAYLVAMSMATEEEFAAVLAAVQGA